MIEEELRLGLDEDVPGLAEYANIPRTIGALISADKASLSECETIYSVEDVYLMLEVIAVDAHNRKTVDEWVRRKHER